ncbi:hypothetical protein HPP92_007177 [Vanilla planifolia]|uniref:Plastid lipid-associated protein/fibrillin conserved domain-containing protein n=1 Tax=Vanilla planifolia TaxID=51239 RepID=A0A835V7G6_VANPL|nr:hypothetical protein HPP92_007177 [Vanilla planifolia]
MELAGSPKLSISASKSFFRLLHPIHSAIPKSNAYRVPNRASLLRLGTAATATMAAAPAAELESRKLDLLRAVQETQRGFSATADQRSFIEELLVSVEGYGAGLPVDLVALDGTWRLNYTSALDVLVLFEAASRLPFFQVGQIFQKFECQNGKNGGLVRNVVRWSIPTLLEEQEGATLLVLQNFCVVTKRNIYLQVDEVHLLTCFLKDLSLFWIYIELT